MQLLAAQLAFSVTFGELLNSSGPQFPFCKVEIRLCGNSSELIHLSIKMVSGTEYGMFGAYDIVIYDKYIFGLHPHSEHRVHKTLGISSDDTCNKVSLFMLNS